MKRFLSSHPLLDSKQQNRNTGTLCSACTQKKQQSFVHHAKPKNEKNLPPLILFLTWMNGRILYKQRTIFGTSLAKLVCQPRKQHTMRTRSSRVWNICADLFRTRPSAPFNSSLAKLNSTALRKPSKAKDSKLTHNTYHRICCGASSIGDEWCIWQHRSQ